MRIVHFEKEGAPGIAADDGSGWHGLTDRESGFPGTLPELIHSRLSGRSKRKASRTSSASPARRSRRCSTPSPTARSKPSSPRHEHRTDDRQGRRGDRHLGPWCIEPRDWPCDGGLGRRPDRCSRRRRSGGRVAEADSLDDGLCIHRKAHHQARCRSGGRNGRPPDQAELRGAAVGDARRNRGSARFAPAAH
jgi:hypothetical protein